MQACENEYTIHPENWKEDFVSCYNSCVHSFILQIPGGEEECNNSSLFIMQSIKLSKKWISRGTPTTYFWTFPVTSLELVKCHHWCNLIIIEGKTFAKLFKISPSLISGHSLRPIPTPIPNPPPCLPLHWVPPSLESSIVFPAGSRCASSISFSTKPPKGPQDWRPAVLMVWIAHLLLIFKRTFSNIQYTSLHLVNCPPPSQPHNWFIPWGQRLIPLIPQWNILLSINLIFPRCYLSFPFMLMLSSNYLIKYTKYS